MENMVSSAVSAAIGPLTTQLSASVTRAVERARATLMPPLLHFPKPSTHYPFSPAHSFTPHLPLPFPGHKGYSPCLPGPPSLSQPPPTTSVPLPPTTSVPPARPPPPSPTHQTLRPVEDVLSEFIDWLGPGRVGRLAIKLARECVFGTDVMARGRLNKDGLHYIRYTLR